MSLRAFLRLIGKLPPMREWILWILIYGMDVKVNNIDETMRAYAKTDISPTHLMPPWIIYDAEAADRKMKIYPKSEMIKSKKIDFKGKTNDITVDNNIIRLSIDAVNNLPAFYNA